MTQKYSSLFIKLNWLALVLIFAVIIAGSVVRTTGSGMGCPDWPKCFGSWVPPTDAKELPQDYKKIYGELRVKKVEKFCKFLTSIGMSETAERIKKDPSVYEELPFNAGKTWTEYMNRWVGFLAGNAVFIAFLWTLIRYRKSRILVLLSLATLLTMGVNGWFGSVVVATNLVPWTITVHMFLALLVVVLQLMILRRIVPAYEKPLNLPNGMKWLIIVILLITTYQMFLGTQVREYIDELTKQGLGRESWSSNFGWSFFIHRSFSWLVLVLILLLGYFNHKTEKIKAIYWAVACLTLELIGGVLLAYADMPGLVQVSHLFFAAVLFGILVLLFLRQYRVDGKRTSSLLQ